MHSRATRQGQLRRVLRFLVLLAVFVALNVAYILVMFASRYATVEGKSDFGNGGNLTAGFEGVEMPHRPGAAVSYAAHLLLLLETYLGKGSGGLLRGSDTWTPAFPSNATPHSVLSGYYSEGLPKLNSRLERRLDGGSMMDGVHSDSFWSTPHIVRRGYGLEGSIFVALMHREVPSSRERRPVQFESRCAMTIYDMYETAQWPVAIFTGIVEVVHDAVSGKEPKGRDGEGSPRWRALPPSRCLPAAYQSHSCAQRRGFCPRDNIRLRQIRGPTKSESEKRARGMKEKGGRSQRVDGNGYNGGSKGQTSDSDGEDNYRRDFTSSAAHRYATLSLYRGETYVLFLNDGLLLVPSWDVKTRLMLLQLPSRYPVLTQKANIIARGIVRQAWKGSVLCNATITSSNNGKAAEDMDTYNCDPNQKRKRDKSTDTSKRAPLRSRLDHGCAAGTLDLNSGSDNGQCSRGLWEEDVVEFLFRLPSDDVETSGSYGVDDHMDEAEPVSPKTVGDHPSFRQSRQPNRIQLYWMRKLRETLRTELKKRMSEWDTTTFICGVMVKVLDELRVKNVCTEGNRHCGAGMGNTSSSEEGGGILRLRTNSVRRLSDTLHDPQYMHPSPLHRCVTNGLTPRASTPVSKIVPASFLHNRG
uniref:Uncharacterized protein n=1 Tax=Trypanosoma congolense (strain IL3000) TaxID=1068625 RepID=G0UJA2_TRYCI|nr:conserved hypothetical protein [Trypanosoma congolense IL3000]